MFKVNKLEDVNEEKIIIDYVTQENYVVDKKKSEVFKTLSFSIEGKVDENKYVLSFNLNCRPEELLKIDQSKNINFNSYLFNSETYFTVNGITELNPKIEITINRYLKNKFIILIHFYSEVLNNDNNTYSGIIEFDFNLDDYIIEENV